MDNTPDLTGDKLDEMLQTMRQRHKTAIDATTESRENQLDDTRFAAASPDNQWQWPQEVLATRGSVQGQAINARPSLTINKLPQHIKQVTNDQRQNRPTGKVIPADDGADIEVAELFNGMVRHIEYISDADVAYDTACENQVTSGEGYIRVLTEYCDTNTFDQDLRIVRVRNPFSVYMDPAIQDPCGSDAEWCFVTDDMPSSDYERLYPDASPVSSLLQQGVGDVMSALWASKSTIRIAEYFFVEYKDVEVYLYADGATTKSGSQQDVYMRSMKKTPVKTRRAAERIIRWIKTNGYEVLEQSVWAGKYIPVIRVVGNEVEIDGKIYVSGIVRNAKDAQRMYNYWVSQEAEMLALAPKAPFIGYSGQFEGYENQWKSANTQNWPYLEVNADITDAGGMPFPLPIRSQPPMASSGLSEAKAGAADDIKSTTGQYDSSLGLASNERTGRAIMARQKQSDVGTYHYVDNYARAIRYVTRQLVDLIPKIYDTKRVARIVNIDGSVNMARIDPSQSKPVKSVPDPKDPSIIMHKVYNPTVGKYDVCVDTGPGYMTKRQEALDAMQMLLQTNPELWKVAGDLFVKNMDWPGAQEMADRFAKTIDPKLMTGNATTPEMQAAMQQIQAQQAQLMAAEHAIEAIKQSMDNRRIEIKQIDAQIKGYDAETRRIAAMAKAMSPEQIQDMVMGTLHGMIANGDLDSPLKDKLQPADDGSSAAPSPLPADNSLSAAPLSLPADSPPAASSPPLAGGQQSQ